MRTGNVWVVDQQPNWIKKFTPDGQFLEKFGGTGTLPGLFDRAEDVAIDRDGYFYITDPGNDRIQKFGPAPTPARPATWGRQGPPREASVIPGWRRCFSREVPAVWPSVCCDGLPVAV
jgi:hypothetical protein